MRHGYGERASEGSDDLLARTDLNGRAMGAVSGYEEGYESSTRPSAHLQGQERMKLLHVAALAFGGADFISFDVRSSSVNVSLRDCRT